MKTTKTGRLMEMEEQIEILKTVIEASQLGRLGCSQVIHQKTGREATALCTWLGGETPEATRRLVPLAILDPDIEQSYRPKGTNR